MDDETLTRLLDEDPRRQATKAGLRYVDDDEPGYQRLPWGRGFTYRDERGSTVRSRQLRQRFEALAIPPAWDQVWICRDPRGHLQVTGRDEANRKQYLYHPRWDERRQQKRSERMLAFGWLLSTVRRTVRRHLRRDELDYRRVHAAVVRLLETTTARVGGAEYAADNDTYGLATIRKRHVAEVEGGVVRLSFEGKGSQPWEIDVLDDRVLAVVSACLEVPGYELFKYFDDSGEKRDVTAASVNDYLHEVAGHRVHAKDFRTWAATVEAARLVDGIPPSQRTASAMLLAVDGAADKLRNTRAICRSSYICREILDRFERQSSRGDALCDELPELRRDERAVVEFLSEVVVAGDAPSRTKASA